MYNVLIVSGSLRTGGMETVVMNTVRYSDKSKFKFDIVVYGDDLYDNEAEAIKLGCRVIHIEFPHKSPLAFVNNLKNIINKYGPYDVVHAHTLFNCGLVVKVAKDEGIPVRISHSHTNRLKKPDSLIRRIYEYIMRKFIHHYSTDFYACSERAGKFLFSEKECNEICIMKNGVYLPKFNVNNSTIEKYRKSLKLVNKKVIIQVGSLVDVKNHMFSLKVMQKLVNEGHNVILLIVGSGINKLKIENEIHRLKLEENVCLLGNRDDIPQLLAVSDVFFMPSHYEGVSLAMIEAQAAGLQCVVSNTACAKEVRITNQITDLKLTYSLDLWCEAILNAASISKNQYSKDLIKDKGYSVEDIVRKLNTDYIRYINR